jgi:hypothetical protein
MNQTVAAVCDRRMILATLIERRYKAHESDAGAVGFTLDQTGRFPILS